ncbi:MAG: HNH endonuclease [Myxacorys californica WJT36-NPBG1]|nr:HNH endonuclease [Myxacorys californica WJT36-NPBG1]
MAKLLDPNKMSTREPLRELGRKSQKCKLRAVVKQRFGGACAYCGRTPRVLTLDHIVAQSKGGANVLSNLAAVCQRCNLSKGSRLLWQWWQASPWWNEARAIEFAATVLVCKIQTPITSLIDSALPLPPSESHQSPPKEFRPHIQPLPLPETALAYSNFDHLPPA